MLFVKAETLMPKGPKGEKRPADVVGTGEIEEETPDPAKELMRKGGEKGGKAR